MDDKLLEALRADYIESCMIEKVEYDEKKFDSYLDLLFDRMEALFKIVNGEK